MLIGCIQTMPFDIATVMPDLAKKLELFFLFISAIYPHVEIIKKLNLYVCKKIPTKYVIFYHFGEKIYTV